MGRAYDPYADGTYHPERERNPFVRSTAGGRVLSALQLPWFTLLPPRGYGVITTTGRRTGKPRRKCVRAIRDGDRVYMVSIPGAQGAWLLNLRANPQVSLRLRGGTTAGVARELDDPGEIAAATKRFCEAVVPFDYAACTMHRRGLPTRAKFRELFHAWYEGGIPLVVELDS